jgi:hypothetical protein
VPGSSDFYAFMTGSDIADLLETVLPAANEGLLFLRNLAFA